MCACVCVCMRACACGGRRPVRPTAVLKDDGYLTKGPEEVLDH